MKISSAGYHNSMRQEEDQYGLKVMMISIVGECLHKDGIEIKFDNGSKIVLKTSHYNESGTITFYPQKGTRLTTRLERNGVTEVLNSYQDRMKKESLLSLEDTRIEIKEKTRNLKIDNILS